MSKKWHWCAACGNIAVTRTGTFHRDTYIDTAGYAAVAEIIHLQREGEDA